MNMDAEAVWSWSDGAKCEPQKTPGGAATSPVPAAVGANGCTATGRGGAGRMRLHGRSRCKALGASAFGAACEPVVVA